MKFQDLMQMQPCQRLEYVRLNGLSSEEKKELLYHNEWIASLFREDCFRKQREVVVQVKYVMVDA